jgi:radical SAM protein with 4Fe4S-binding SPASM domain
LKNCKNIQRWEIRLAFRSLYSRGDFDKIKVVKKDIDSIDKWITALSKESKIHIQWDVTGIDRYFKSDKGSRGFIGSRCSANYSNILILPDGKVTICEQLYWHPEYIIGDLTTQSIEEVWNSPRALELAFPHKEHFRDESVCKHCDIFEECHAYPNKCFIDVLKGYGNENGDYPDPRCIKAPPFVNELRY